MRKFLQIKNDKIIREIELSFDEYSIGRDDTNDIVFKCYKISKEHAKLIKDNNSYVIINLNTNNELKVNGNKINTKLLESGDIVELSDRVKLIYIKEDVSEELQKYNSYLEALIEERTRELKEYEENFRNLAEYSLEGIIIIQNKRIVYSNRTACEIFEYPFEEFVTFDREKLMETVHLEDRNIIITQLNKRRTFEVEGSEIRIITKNKRIKWLEVFSKSIKYKNKKALQIVMLDITEKKFLEDRLKQIQKMESIARLAGGIAHDFNNMLTVIIGYTELLSNKLSKEPDLYRQINIIKNTAQKGADLTRHLLTFSKKTVLNLQPTNINSLVEETINILSRLFPKEIEIKYNLDKKLRIIEVDQTQLCQVLMNISINARDAMPSGGILYFETSNITLDKKFCQTHPWCNAVPGNYVNIKIQDTGTGIPEEYIDHIFEPFFTTKEIGQGTGLGLAMVYGIVKSHNGLINVISDLNKGTTFSLYFPCEKNIKMKQVKQQGFDIKSYEGKETILLVDDEPDIIELISKTLEKLGYKVITAQNGKEGFDLYLKHRKDIKLIILDIIMPVMNGRKFLKKLREYDKEIKVIVTTGYNDEDIYKLQDIGIDSFVTKPYNIDNFVRTIRNILDR